MKPVQSIVALGACLTALHAHAQSNVAMYGALDVTAERVSAGAIGNTGRLSSNSSNFGFRGSEELGAGLKAIFQIEGAVGVDQGTGGINSRDSFVGLSGGFGTVKLGFFTAPMRAMGGKICFLPGASSIANNIGLFTTLNGSLTNLNSRLPNALQYATPTIAGTVATLVYAPGENKPGGFNDFSYGAGLNYTRGGLYLGYAYESRRAQQKLALGNSNDWEHRLAARYTFGDSGVGMGWDRLGSDGLYGGAAGAIARNAWTFSAMHAMGAHDLNLYYTLAKQIQCSGLAIAGQCAPGKVGSTGARQISLVYHYTFSKRTLFQAFYSAIHNDDNAVYDFDVNPVVSTTTARQPGVAPRGIGAGFRHTF